LEVNYLWEDVSQCGLRICHRGVRGMRFFDQRGALFSFFFYQNGAVLKKITNLGSRASWHDVATSILSCVNLT